MNVPPLSPGPRSRRVGAAPSWPVRSPTGMLFDERNSRRLRSLSPWDRIRPLVLFARSVSFLYLLSASVPCCRTLLLASFVPSCAAIRTDDLGPFPSVARSLTPCRLGGRPVTTPFVAVIPVGWPARNFSPPTVYGPFEEVACP